MFLLLAFSFETLACDDKTVYADKTYPEVLIKTSMGDILVELDRNRAPITVNNFLQYVKSGAFKKTIFHRVEKGFVVQGGGYDGHYKNVKECNKIYNESGNGLRNTVGTIAMARFDDPHSATSQFYFNLKDSPSLDPNPKNWGYAVFGEVTEGMDVLEQIGNVRVGFSKTLNAENVPNEPITIIDVIVQ